MKHLLLPALFTVFWAPIAAAIAPDELDWNIWVWDMAAGQEQLFDGQLDRHDTQTISIGDDLTLRFSAVDTDTYTPEDARGKQHHRLFRRVTLMDRPDAVIASNFTSSTWPADVIGAFWVPGGLSNSGLQHVDITNDAGMHLRVLFQGQRLDP